MIIIWQICMREKDLFPSQRKEMADFYFILERYKVIDTKCWKDYEYTLDSRGEALYFKRIKREERKTEIYDTAFQGEGMEFIPVPYRQGDILYIVLFIMWAMTESVVLSDVYIPNAGT